MTLTRWRYPAVAAVAAILAAGAGPAAAYADDPPICPSTATATMSFSPTTIHQGEQTRVTWDVDAPEPSCPLSGLWMMNSGADGPPLDAHGSMMVTPGSTRDWQLSASFTTTSGAEGQSHDETGQLTSATITVLPAIPLTTPTTRITANTAAQRELFVRAVSTPNETVVIDGSVDLDLSWLENVEVAAGVQLLGDRSVNARGPRLFTTTRPRWLLLVGNDSGRTADNVRVSGIRFDGGEPDDPCDSADNHPDSDGVSVFSSQHVEIDHNEFYKWRGSAVNVHDDDRNRLDSANMAWVHDSSFHDNQHPTTCNLLSLSGHGAGYGVNVGDGAYALIERNVFDKNRHAIASNGHPGTGYLAYRNLFLFPGIDSVHGPFTNYNHQIDVHGVNTCGNGESYNCGPAGEYFDIAYNSVLSGASHAIQLRGNPSDSRGMSVENNRFDDFQEQSLTKTQPENRLFDNGGNIFQPIPSDNTEGTLTPLRRKAACDFDGDGTADDLLASGVAWWYASSRLGGRWSYLADSRDLIGDIRVRDVNGDGLCDAIGTGGDVHLGERGLVLDNTNDFGSPVAMARNSGGALELAGTNAVDATVRQTQGAGGWSGSSWQLFETTKRSIALELNGSGRMEAVAVDADDNIFTRQQTRPGDWTGSTWQQLDGQLRSVALARDTDGRLELFGTNAAGTVWHRTQSAIGSWAGSVWTAYDGFLNQVAAETNADGRVELFGVNHAGEIYHRVQSHAGDWTGSRWLGMDGQLSDVALARNLSGKLEVFGTNPYGDLWHRTQTAAGDWTGSTWQPLDGKASQLAAETTTDGRVDLFAVDAAGGLHDRTQKTAGNWDGSAWTTIGGSLRPTRPVVPTQPLSLTAGDRTNTVMNTVNMRFNPNFGTAPYHWSVTGLPPGLTMDANGSVTGQPAHKGTYPVVVTVRDSSNPSATATAAFTWTIQSADCWSTTTDNRVVAIPDPGTATLTYANGCTTNASATATVSVNITYPHVGDIYIDLTAPSGRTYVLQTRSGNLAPNLVRTFTVNLGGEPMEGIWSMRVIDGVQGGAGQINRVSLALLP